MTAEEIALAVIKLPPEKQIAVHNMVCRLHDMCDPRQPEEVMILAMRIMVAMWEQEKSEVAPCSK